jgi:hypothetical protein
MFSFELRSKPGVLWRRVSLSFKYVADNFFSKETIYLAAIWERSGNSSKLVSGDLSSLWWCLLNLLGLALLYNTKLLYTVCEPLC